MKLNHQLRMPVSVKVNGRRLFSWRLPVVLMQIKPLSRIAGVDYSVQMRPSRAFRFSFGALVLLAKAMACAVLPFGGRVEVEVGKP